MPLKDFKARFRKSLLLMTAIGLTAMTLAIFTLCVNPLYNELKSMSVAKLSSLAEAKASAAEEFVAGAQAIARQIASRSQMRESLEQYNSNQIPLEKLNAFTSPKMVDAMKVSAAILAVARLDLKGNTVIVEGLSARGISEVPPKIGEPFPALELIPAPDETEVRISGRVTVDERTALLLSSPILGRNGTRVGSDVILYDLTGISELITKGDSAALRTRLDWKTDLHAPAILERDGWVSAVHPGPVPGSAVIVDADSTELFKRIDGIVSRLGLITLGTLVAGLLCMVYLLHTLTDKVIIRSETREAEAEEKKRLEVQLRQAVKLEAIGRLAGGVAHDFNNILSSIMGYSDLLLAQTSEDDPIRGDLAAIFEAGEKAAELTRQLLIFSRNQALDIKPVSINRVVREISRMLSRLIGEDVTLSLNLAADTDVIDADEGQIGQVLLNLAVNAKDAMPKGGCVEISTASVYLDETYVKEHPETEEPGNFVLLSVSDSGHGMSSEVKTRIFEPFFTTKPIGRGTGLGLSTVYGIVRQHRGHIFVYSEPDMGTTFKIYFPASKETEVSRVPECAQKSAGGSESILVVDDEAIICRLIESSLTPLGYEVVTTTSPEEAATMAKNQQTSFDMLLTDMVMPGLNGYELAKMFRASNPETTIVFMSGYSRDILDRKGILKSDAHLIDKPIVPSRMTRMIRSIFDSKKR